MEEKNETFAITPKGLILIALGGYLGGKQEDAQKVVTELIKFMKRDDFGIIVKNDKLKFVNIVTTKRKKFLGLF